VGARSFACKQSIHAARLSRKCEGRARHDDGSLAAWVARCPCSRVLLPIFPGQTSSIDPVAGTRDLFTHARREGHDGAADETYLLEEATDCATPFFRAAARSLAVRRRALSSCASRALLPDLVYSHSSRFSARVGLVFSFFQNVPTADVQRKGAERARRLPPRQTNGRSTASSLEPGIDLLSSPDT